MTPSPRIEGLVVGLALVALGLLWTLANLGRINLLDTLHRWWPSILIVWGVLELSLLLWRRVEQRRLP